LEGDKAPLGKGIRGFLLVFLFFPASHGLVFAQTEAGDGSVPVLFAAFTAQDREEANQLASAMQAELEWISRASGYSIHQSRYAMKRPPSLDGLAAVDRILNPQYIINGIITEEGNVSVAEIELWNIESQSLLFSQAFEFRQIDDALSMVPYYAWSLYAILPVLENSANEIEAIRAELEAARAEAEAAKARAEALSAGSAATGTEAYFSGTAASETSIWKNRWLYIGVRGGVSPRFYFFESDFPNELGFTWEAGLQVEFQFLRLPWGGRTMFFAIQGEALFTMDKFSLSEAGENAAEKTLFSLMTPVLLKFNYKPGPFVLSPYGGMYYIQYFPAASPVLGYSAGFKLGMKAWKRGTFFIDLRFSNDIDSTEIEGDFPVKYRRTIPSISLGYEIGLLNRK
jgi:hypothetical protein